MVEELVVQEEETLVEAPETVADVLGLHSMQRVQPVREIEDQVSAGAREFFCAYIDDIVGSLARRVWLSRKPAHRGQRSPRA